MAAKRAHVATRGQTPEGEKPERDTRPVVKPAVVRSMLVAASSAAQGAFEASAGAGQWPRFPLPTGSWPTIRCAVHSLRDDERRAVVLMLLGEESTRIEHELGASMNGSTG
jgi:hypothetical protein